VQQRLIAPVHAIIGYAEIAQEEARSRVLDSQAADIARILTATRSLGERVAGLVAASRDGGAGAGRALATERRSLQHELRTPLNAIIGYSDLLAEDLAGSSFDDLRACVVKVRASAVDLLSRLDAFLSLPDGRIRRAVQGDGHAARASQLHDILDRVGPRTREAAVGAASGHVLVVDDIEANRDVLARRLQREGFRVAVAAGGRRALQLLAKEDFDLILLDLMMPGLNGFEVLARVKADARLRTIPVIMISALDESEGTIRCIEAGAEDYLPKPFDPVLLRARINASLANKRLRDQERLYTRRLEEESQRFERLLVSILPEPIVGRLHRGEVLIADRFDEATVLFSDLVGFTAHSAATAPADVVRYLNRLFSEFDALAQSLGVEKVKTIGDAYLVAGGLPEARADHCEAVVRMALGMIERLRRVNRDAGLSFRMRIGIHSGPVVAGIIGSLRMSYDVWGDTVNFASRLESTAPPDGIHVSQAVVERGGEHFALESRGTLELKGKGSVPTWLVTGAREPGGTHRAAASQKKAANRRIRR
jgi:class 3 adenylate cyclase/CheY-like chemotaxis protein